MHGLYHYQITLQCLLQVLEYYLPFIITLQPSSCGFTIIGKGIVEVIF